jgi:hypothetical protein
MAEEVSHVRNNSTVALTHGQNEKKEEERGLLTVVRK